jgi:hypothetical protein
MATEDKLLRQIEKLMQIGTNLSPSSVPPDNRLLSQIIHEVAGALSEVRAELRHMRKD